VARVAEKLYLGGESRGLLSYVWAGVLGWVLHVLMDTPLYADIKPFYPLVVNPLYTYPGVRAVMAVYDTVLVCGFVTYLLHFYKFTRGEGALGLMRLGSLAILSGIVVGLHAFSFELDVRNE